MIWIWKWISFLLKIDLYIYIYIHIRIDIVWTINNMIISTGWYTIIYIYICVYYSISKNFMCFSLFKSLTEADSACSTGNSADRSCTGCWGDFEYLWDTVRYDIINRIIIFSHTIYIHIYHDIILHDIWYYHTKTIVIIWLNMIISTG